MKPVTLSIASMFTIAMLATGCASNPNTSPVPVAAPVDSVTVAADCRQLDTAIANADAEKRDAQKKEQSAWKAIVPFAVMARYVSGKSAVEAATMRLDQLHADFSRQGCTRHGL